jgi:hypothetical protein
MKNLIISLFVIGCISQVFSQPITLPEVDITAVNYKYLHAVDSDDSAISVKMLQEKVAQFDLRKSEFYDDEYDTYTVSFFIPEGKILAAYDKNGTLIRTIEKFKNVKLPPQVRYAIAERFPKWEFYRDAYLVKYHYEKGVTKNEYKVRIRSGNKVQKIKISDDGDFL